MCLCASSAKSLQEFAAVLQNLEDERTRMVSDQEVVINIIDGRKLIYFSFCEYQPSEMCQCAHMWWRECSLVSWLKFNHLDCKKHLWIVLCSDVWSIHNLRLKLRASGRFCSEPSSRAVLTMEVQNVIRGNYRSYQEDLSGQFDSMNTKRAFLS